MEHVRIFDTTLRDGEQSPGATLTSNEKLEIARALARLRVDVIEAGFPAASPDDLAAVTAIAEEIGGEADSPIICALARAAREDIGLAWRGVSRAARPRIHTFLATSELHMRHKLRMSRAQVKARVQEMVTYARSLCSDVEFSPEDAGRSERDFLYEVLEVAIAAGATTLNIPDTVGYTTPDEFGALITGIREHVPGAKDVIVSVHCHDDLGLATANSLAGVLAGARQVEVTINGIGERAGNAAVEEVVMALHTRAAKYRVATAVDTTQLVRTSRLVSACTGIAVQPNKAIVGANAFAHESGIHQDGMLKHEQTYEIMRPDTVGAVPTQLVLGKHSGRAALAARLADLGFVLAGDQLDRVFARFKTIADRRKHVTDADLDVLVREDVPQEGDAFTLDALHVGCGTLGMPTATVRLRDAAGAVRAQATIGTGPVDAAFKAIDALAGAPAMLLEYNVHSVTEGIDALGRVSVRVRDDRGRIYSGAGADTDIIVASAQAYIRAINRVVATRSRRTLFDKIWDSHVVAAEPERPAILYVDLHLVHEVTSPQAFAGLARRGLAVRRPDRTVATMDHSIPTQRLTVIDDAARTQLRTLADNCRTHGITLYDLDSDRQGIVHVIGPELGLTRPGMTIVCGDSHTSTHGAFGALAFGIGTSEVEHVLATQCLLQNKPKTFEVRCEGALRPGVTAKDLVLAIIVKLGVGGATGHVIEYTGAAIRALDMEGRMTVCNMSIEAGARAGMIAPDEVTFAWLRDRGIEPHPSWRELRTDDGARFDKTLVIDASTVEPMITFGTNPGMAIPITGNVPTGDDAALAKALRYMDLAPGESLLGRRIDVVFIGSCTNARLTDMRAAAGVMRGHHVAAGVRALVVPGSKAVKRDAEAEGLDAVFREAGAEWREPGCSMCIAMNGDALEPGQYAVSTSNRNFEGRQGRGGRTFLASPPTAAAAAVTGRITDVRTLIGGPR